MCVVEGGRRLMCVVDRAGFDVFQVAKKVGLKGM